MEEKSYYDFDPKEDFIKLWTAVIPEINRIRLSGAEMAILLFLARYISYDNFVVMSPSGKHVNSSDIQKALELSPETVKKAVKKFRDKGLIAVSRTAKTYTYIANPYVFSKGGSYNSTLMELFKNTQQYRQLVNLSCRKKEVIEGDAINFPEDATFIRLWINVLPYLTDIGLTGAEWSILLTCFYAARYETGLAAYSNGKPLTVETITKVCNRSCRTITDGLNHLEDLGLIRFEGSELYLNPFVGSRGRRITNKLNQTFRETEVCHLYEMRGEDREEQGLHKRLETLMA